MELLTVRCYARYNAFKNYIPHVEELLSQYLSRIKFLPSIQLGGYFTFDSSCGPNDISILLMTEIWATRESQDSWFMRHTHDIVNNTSKKILFVIFSNIYPETAEQRKISYESQIPNSVVKYIDLYDTYFSEDDKELLMFDSIIHDFMNSL